MIVLFFGQRIEVPSFVTEVVISRDETDLGTEYVKIRFKQDDEYVPESLAREWRRPPS